MSGKLEVDREEIKRCVRIRRIVANIGRVILRLILSQPTEFEVKANIAVSKLINFKRRQLKVEIPEREFIVLNLELL